MSSFNNILNILTELSLKSNLRCKHAAAVIKGKHIIYKGYNHDRGMFQGNACYALHAKQHAMSNLFPNWRRRQCILRLETQEIQHSSDQKVQRKVY